MPGSTVAARGAIVLAVSCALACEALFPLEELGSGASVEDGGDAAVVEAGGGGGSGGADAAGGDAGEPCVSQRGPAMVRAGDLCIDRTEVTNADYARFLVDDAAARAALPAVCSYKTSLTPTDWTLHSQRVDAPVRGVDWCDAAAFCAWAGKRLCGRRGGGATPQDEVGNAGVSEWQFACSGGGDPRLVYPYGETYDGTRCGPPNAGTVSAVASRPGCEGGFPGLFDMSGNVWEWEDACVGSVGADDSCLARGGSYSNDVSTLRCAAAFATTRGGKSFYDVGIRCCR